MEIAPLLPKHDIEQALRAKAEALGIVHVVDAETFEAADENLKFMRGIKKDWIEYWKDIKDNTYKAWKGVVAKEKNIVDVVEERERAQKDDAKVWFDAWERERLEAERLAQEAARRQAEDEALARAVALEAQGEKQEAEAILAAPIPVPQVILPRSVPAGHGGMTQKYYSAVVVDIKALAKAVLEGKVPVQAIQGNDVFLNAQARQFKETMSYPGVRVSVR